MSGRTWGTPELDIVVKAIDNGDFESLERLLVDKTPEFCGKALYIAVMKGSEEYSIVNYSGNGSDEVIRTLENKNKEIVKFFLDRGTDIYARFSKLINLNLIEYACFKASLDIVKMIIDGDFSSEKLFHKRSEPIAYAFRSGKIDKMNLFLDKANADNVNEWHLLNLYVEHATPPQEDVLIKLLNLGADLNPIASVHTVLNCACQGGNLEAFKFLIKNGANVNGINGYNKSELTAAIHSESLEFVKILLEHGANPNLGEETSEDTKNYPLYKAVGICYDWDKCRELMELLLKYGANVNGYEDYQWTPLQEAVWSENTKAVEFLLDRGADVNEEINREHLETALKTSIIHGQWNSSRILVKIMILMMEQGLEISKLNLDTINAVESLKVFKNECIGEIRLLKDTTFDDSCLSYFAIYEIKEVCKLAGLARNKLIVQVLTSNEFNGNFPIYGKMMVEHFHKGILRNKDFELFKRFINYLSTRDHDQLPKLPLTVIPDIFAYLNFNDVANLRKL